MERNGWDRPGPGGGRPNVPPAGAGRPGAPRPTPPGKAAPGPNPNQRVPGPNAPGRPQQGAASAAARPGQAPKSGPAPQPGQAAQSGPAAKPGQPPKSGPAAKSGRPLKSGPAETSGARPPRPASAESAEAGTGRPLVRDWQQLLSRGALATVSLLVFTLTAYAWAQYGSLVGGLHRSGILSGEGGSLNGDTNILIMGLDSRLDEDGNPLPPEIYDALQAGNSNDGGENSNVLMLLHVPANGGKATSISIPRDDYVQIPGCPDGQCRGKIKQAYGLGFDAESKKVANQSGLSTAQKVQQERDAGRRAEIDTVKQLLGGVPVDHYVEVTLVAFFQIAKVVQPITVCVKQNTQDNFSGANFHAGVQQIDAKQAVSFVRQRRDYVHPDLNFTDLDRERRQQAFISSLAFQLKQAGTLADPTKLQGLFNVAKQNLAVDNNLDLLAFAGQASSLTGGNVTFVTLPIDHFGKDPLGEDVNMVNVAAIQALVHQLIGGALPPPPPPSNAGAASGTVDVVNANGQSGLASELEQALVRKGYTQGSTKTESKHQSHSVVYYASGGSSAASGLASTLGGISTEADSSLQSGHLSVVVGTDFTMPSSLSSGDGSGPNAAGPAPIQVVPAAATPPPPPPGADPTSNLSTVNGGGVPCVK